MSTLRPELNIRLPGESLERGAAGVGKLDLVKGSKAIAAATGLSQREVLKFIHANEMPGNWIGNKFVTDRATVEAWIRVKLLGNALAK